MLDFIKDLLGINRYVIAWKYERNGETFEDDTREMWRHLGGGISKRAARALVSRLHRAYGPGTHWIERVNRAGIAGGILV